MRTNKQKTSNYLKELVKDWERSGGRITKLKASAAQLAMPLSWDLEPVPFSADEDVARDIRKQPPENKRLK